MTSVLLQAGAALASAVLMAAPEPPKASGPYAIVASGGVSQGSYQAGVTYVLLAWLRSSPEARLEVVTGASAGNINAFLSAITWLEDRKDLSASNNLLWKNWIDIGWEKLAPTTRDCAEYRALFSDGQRNILDGKPLRFEGDTCPYTSEDGLVTRRAFAAAMGDLKAKLKEASYGPRHAQDTIMLGVTLNAVKPLEDLGGGVKVVGTRVAAPMVVRALPSRSLSLTNLSSEAPNAPKGRWIQFANGEEGAEIERDDILSTIQASSAFPVAFAPKEVPNVKFDHLPPGAETERFSDGGLFDNVPLGLALDLAGSRASEMTYFYVWPDLRRRPIGTEGPGASGRGLGYVQSILGHFIQESQGYELQGLYRYRGPDVGADQGRLLIADRFFPLVSSYMIWFGAFLKLEYRIHDYLVGLYDGIYAITRQQLMFPDRSGGADPRVKREGCTLGKSAACDELFVNRFHQVACGLLDKQAVDLPGQGKMNVMPFLFQLLDYEHSKTSPFYGPGSLHARSCGVAPRPDVKPISAHGPQSSEGRPEDKVWSVFDALLELDEKGRYLSSQGSPAERRAYAAEAGDLHELLAWLPKEARPDGANVDLVSPWSPWPARPPASNEVAVAPRPERYGLEDFERGALDRLIRRAGEIEDQDAARLEEQPEHQRPPGLPRWMFEAARLGLAWGGERSPVVVDLNASSIPRLIPDHPFWSNTLAVVLPSYVSTGLVQPGVELGWELRLRWPQTGLFAGLRLAAALDREWASTPGYSIPKLGFGLGFDPRGRVMDDLQFTAVARWAGGPAAPFWPRPWPPAAANRLGLEVSAALFTRFRLGLEWSDLFWESGPGVRSPDVVRTLLNPQITVGLADAGGSLVALVQALVHPSGEHPSQVHP